MPETYSRGQAIYALWQFFAPIKGCEPPTFFQGQVRAMYMRGIPCVAEEKPGPGNRTRYTTFDIFELGVAITLQDHGVSIGEAAHLVRHMRPQLEAWHHRIVESPQSSAQNAYLSSRFSQFFDGRADKGRLPKGQFPEISSARIIADPHAFAAELAEMAGSGEGRLILPLNRLATDLARYLAEVPDFKPGPRRAA